MLAKNTGRPKRFYLKPEKNDPNRLRRISRPTPSIIEAAKMFSGSDKKKVMEAATLALVKLPQDFSLGLEKERVFKRNAEQATKSRLPIGRLSCAERCNLAIALLNAAGIKAWLARGISIGTLGKELHFHDFVETMIDGKVHTLLFRSTKPMVLRGKVQKPLFSNTGSTLDSYDIRFGSVNKLFPERGLLILRGADSKQIGGVGKWRELERFVKKLKKNPTAEKEKDKRRLALMLSEGIIPNEAMEQIR